MKYVHVSAAVPEDVPALFSKRRRVLPGQQAQKYNRLLGTGFLKNGFDIVMLSQVPLGFKDAPFRLVAPENKHDKGLDYRFIGFLNVPVLKNICAYACSRRFVKKVIKQYGAANVRITCDLLSLSAAMGAVDAASKYGALALGIITDLPEHMSGRTSTGLYGKYFLRCVRKTSGLITVTRSIGERFDKPFTVIEGIATPSGPTPGTEALPNSEARDIDRTASLVCDFENAYRVDFSKEKVFFYAGGIEKSYGVKLMVNAFIKAGIPDSRLVLCGGGSFADELSETAENDRRIVFAGIKSNSVVTALEKRSFLLINPRTSEGEFTAFSFPSKNLEYMSSGTPMAGFMLPGIPDGYRELMFIPANETEDSLAELLAKLADLPPDEVRKKGLAAADYVLKNKSPEAQARAVEAFFDDL